MGRDASSQAAWEGASYAAESGHHRSFDDWFLAAHPPGQGDRIVDAGCGSGEFTARLAELAPEGHVVGVDRDPSMLEVAARHASDDLEFRQASLQDLDQVCPASWADLVVSRAVFHWIALSEYRGCYEAVWRVLRPGGWFHAESGGAGNVRHVGELLDDVAAGFGLGPTTVTFPDAGVAFELLEQAGFEVPPSGVTTVAQRRAFTFERLLGFIRTQATVALGLDPNDERFEPFVATARDRIEELRRHDGSYDQTFVRLHVRARRPG